MLEAWGVSAKGGVRPTNQDRFAIDEARHLCVVADGLGGHNAGEVAARTAVDALLDVVSGSCQIGRPFGVDPSLSAAGNLVRTAIHLANMQVVEAAVTSPAFAGMGTTIVAALVDQGRLSVGHVGDSRLYLHRGGRLRQVTGDDSWAAAVAAGAPIQAELIQHHPLRHVLTNVVGRGRRTEVHVAEEPLAPGDGLLLTTDGVHGVLGERCLERLLTSADCVVTAASSIVRTALARGSQDNCTAVVARYTARFSCAG